MAARRYELRVLKWAKRTSEISFQHSNVIFCLLLHKLNTKSKALHLKVQFLYQCDRSNSDLFTRYLTWGGIIFKRKFAKA